MYNLRIRALGVAAVVIAVAVLNSQVSAAVLGNLNLTNGIGGGVTLSSNSMDFLLPVAGGNGAIATGIGTSVSYTGGGPVGAGVTGLVRDVPSAFGTLTDFITLATDPSLHFDLTGIGPGVANTTAVNTLDPNSAPSSPYAGSFYIMQATSTGTSLTFSVSGIARDASSPDSLWTGLFTTQLAGVTPFQVQQTLMNGGTVSSTFSASINASGVIPEPGSVAMLGIGLLAMFRRARRA